jgi:alpha-amylase/alpha-mannosidase (GH57 family)
MNGRVALLLHMHQPDYRDPETGEPVMPWVRLHASRGYTDVPALLAQYGGRATVNVVPGLLDQLIYYRDGGTDRWERLSRTPAERLSIEEREFVRRRFVNGHAGMRRGSARYQNLEANIHALTDPHDLRDLQVWSNLAWMGAVGRRDPRAASLLAQDCGFSHAQLIGLMDLQHEVVAGVLARWRELPEISCSPYDHPILPLLVDLSHARRSQADLTGLDGVFEWPDDAKRQVTEALDRVEEVLGRRPVGMWPSEGAVSPEVVALLANCGVRWAASDQGVLEHSDRDGAPDISKAWRAGGLSMVFRDRALSDRIGFSYADQRGSSAARDLLGSIGEDEVVPVILDGENPWEAYPDAGESFLRALFSSGRTLTIGDALERMAEGQVNRLHTGSWIAANLAIWAGHPDDRVAWRQLGMLRQAWEDAGRPPQTWPHLRSAEGSDWCWWYGPENHSEMHDLFDELFRAHLSAGWRSLDLEAPLALASPLNTVLEPGSELG